jgi:hypothetical protein
MDGQTEAAEMIDTSSGDRYLRAYASKCCGCKSCRCEKQVRNSDPEIVIRQQEQKDASKERVA